MRLMMDLKPLTKPLMDGSAALVRIAVAMEAISRSLKVMSDQAARTEQAFIRAQQVNEDV